MSRRNRWHQMQSIDLEPEVLEGEIVDTLPRASEVGSLSDLWKTITSAGSSASDKALEKVKSEAGKGAEEAVVKQIKTNAVHIFIIAVAAGAVGGLVSEKAGTTGAIIMTGLAAWSGWQIMNVGAKK